MTQSVSAGHFSKSGNHSRRFKINILDAQLPIRYSLMAMCAFGIFLARVNRQRKVHRLVTAG